jgi:hypothetical protein
MKTYITGIQRPTENGHKDKRTCTKHYTKIKYRATRTPRKTDDEFSSFGWVNSSLSTFDTRRVTPDTNPIINK